MLFIAYEKNIYFDYDSCFNQWVGNDYSTQEYKKWFSHLEVSIGNIENIFDFWCEKNKEKCMKFINEFIEAYNIIAEEQELDYIIDSEQVLVTNSTIE